MDDSTFGVPSGTPRNAMSQLMACIRGGSSPEAGPESYGVSVAQPANPGFNVARMMQAMEPASPSNEHGVPYQRILLGSQCVDGLAMPAAQRAELAEDIDKWVRLGMTTNPPLPMALLPLQREMLMDRLKALMAHHKARRGKLLLSMTAHQPSLRKAHPSGKPCAAAAHKQVDSQMQKSHAQAQGTDMRKAMTEGATEQAGIGHASAVYLNMFAKAEGYSPHGALGYTSSSKPVMSHAHPSNAGIAQHYKAGHDLAHEDHKLGGAVKQAFPKFSRTDHIEAAEMHFGERHRHSDHAALGQAHAAAAMMSRKSSSSGQEPRVHSKAVVIYKSMLKKAGGPGSRGGQVVGKTKSGKPIYLTKDAAGHKGFTSADHHDAAALHEHISDHHEKAKAMVPGGWMTHNTGSAKDHANESLHEHHDDLATVHGIRATQHKFAANKLDAKAKEKA